MTMHERQLKSPNNETPSPRDLWEKWDQWGQIIKGNELALREQGDKLLRDLLIDVSVWERGQGIDWVLHERYPARGNNFFYLAQNEQGKNIYLVVRIDAEPTISTWDTPLELLTPEERTEFLWLNPNARGFNSRRRESGEPNSVAVRICEFTLDSEQDPYVVPSDKEEFQRKGHSLSDYREDGPTLKLPGVEIRPLRWLGKEVIEVEKGKTVEKEVKEVWKEVNEVWRKGLKYNPRSFGTYAGAVIFRYDEEALQDVPSAGKADTMSVEFRHPEIAIGNDWSRGSKYGRGQRTFPKNPAHNVNPIIAGRRVLNLLRNAELLGRYDGWTGQFVKA